MGKTVAGMGAHKYLFPPKLAFPLPEYAPGNKMSEGPVSKEVSYDYFPEMSRKYVADIQSGYYDPYMYSIFEVPLETPEQIMALPDDHFFFNVDPKLGGKIGGNISGNFIHLKNESMSRDWALSVNGVDEEYRGHIYADTDFGYRLAAAGAQWMLLDSVSWVSIVNPRHITPHILLKEHPELRRAKYEAVRRSPHENKVANNSVNLRDFDNMLWWY